MEWLIVIIILSIGRYASMHVSDPYTAGVITAFIVAWVLNQ